MSPFILVWKNINFLQLKCYANILFLNELINIFLSLNFNTYHQHKQASGIFHNV